MRSGFIWFHSHGDDLDDLRNGLTVNHLDGGFNSHQFSSN